MFLAILLKRVLPFVLGSVFGVFAYYFLVPIEVPPPNAVVVTEQGSGNSGGQCAATGLGPEAAKSVAEKVPLKIFSKPRATFTELAREKNVQGSVRLKVTLLANGKVGSINVVNGLPEGLTEQAIAAARKIKFEPEKVNGKPVSKVITIDYSFDIY